MRCIIAGGREASYADTLNAINQCPFANQITSILSGKCRGADTHGETIAKQRGLPVDPYPAEWNKYGMGAGMIRNGVMAQNADALIAVWDGKSSGTKDMIKKAHKYGLEVFVFRYGENK